MSIARFHRPRRLRDLCPVLFGTLVFCSLIYYLALSRDYPLAASDLLDPLVISPSLRPSLADLPPTRDIAPPVLELAAPPTNHAEEDERVDARYYDIVPPTINLQGGASTGPNTSQNDVLETEIVGHQPGWTVFRNLYMSGGTLFVVTSKPGEFPEVKFMTSTGLPADATPENAEMRMPTRDNMDFLKLEDARVIWGKDGWTRRGVLPVHGNTWLFNDPPQFLDHYYHFCAELLFGTWAFWTGTFNSSFTPYGKCTAPSADRAIFIHSGNEWRDKPGFNAYFLRAAFPSLTVETDVDWMDRVEATRTNNSRHSKAFRFDTVLLADRSAAFRGVITGERTQRTAASALEPMRRSGRLGKWWWEPVRRSVLRFAGVDEQTMNIGANAHGVISEKDQMRGVPLSTRPLRQEIVVTYISRQAVRRRLVQKDHEGLVAVLTELCSRRGWELNVVAAEDLGKDEQVKIMARTTVLLGVHGNGLTHLILLPITPKTTVIEIFYPGGFARDYEWTARALGFKHFAVRYNTYATYPKEPVLSYPEGFQGENIPVHGPTVGQLIESRIDGKL